MATTDSTDDGSNVDDSKNPIIDPRESDVLCGRGGAALRHPGNLTYRRLVNLNKGLYITCLKTEKLKISRSIVAAIREQRGRFLERDATAGVWIDIGDKKAIEKTSQALREGQPKLRKKMVELGQIPAEQLVAADHVVDPVQQQQDYGNGIYNPRQQQNNMNNNMNMNNNFGGGSQEFPNSNPIGYLQQQQLELEQQQRNQIAMMKRRSQQAQHQLNSSFNNSSSSFNNNSFSEIPAPLRATSNSTMNDFNEVSMLQRLSLAPATNSARSIPSWAPTINSVRTIPSWTPSISSVDFMDGLGLDEQLLSTARNHSHTSFNRGNTSYGGPSPSNNSEINVPQQIGTTGGRDDNFFAPDRMGSLDPDEPEPQQQKQQQQQRQTSTSAGDRGRSGNNANGRQRSPVPPTIDQRRRFFAKMKSERTANGLSSRSITDGMPDIHMVDSQFSLLSNLSGHGSKHQGAYTMDISLHRSKHNGAANTMDISTHKDKNKESIGSEYIGVGSRRSLMSGLSTGVSKFSSGHSDINNVFSNHNMSKKIVGGTNHQNVSSRSLAMSEFSGIDEEFAEDDFNYELPPSRTASRTG